MHAKDEGGMRQAANQAYMTHNFAKKLVLTFQAFISGDADDHATAGFGYAANFGNGFGGSGLTGYFIGGVSRDEIKKHKGNQQDAQDCGYRIKKAADYVG